jgi:hypothetical protein
VGSIVGRADLALDLTVTLVLAAGDFILPFSEKWPPATVLHS